MLLSFSFSSARMSLTSYGHQTGVAYSSIGRTKVLYIPRCLHIYFFFLEIKIWVADKESSNLVWSNSLNGTSLLPLHFQGRYVTDVTELVLLQFNQVSFGKVVSWYCKFVVNCIPTQNVSRRSKIWPNFSCWLFANSSKLSLFSGPSVLIELVCATPVFTSLKVIATTCSAKDLENQRASPVLLAIFFKVLDLFLTLVMSLP